MDSYCHNISDYAFGDAKSSLLSLQFLQEMDEDPPLSPPRIDHSHVVRNQHQQVDQIKNHQSHFANIPQTTVDLPRKQEEPQLPLSNVNEKCEQSLTQKQAIDRQLEPCKSEIIQTLHNLEQSNISNQHSKGESFYREGQALHKECHQQLHMLKQLEQQALAEINESEQAELVKQNFQMLFQRVYGIIQQIQHRNEKAELSKSQFNSSVKCSAKKQLGFNPRVIQLSVGKQNDSLKKKKFCSNLRTQFNFDKNACDEGQSELKGEENWWIQTPIPSTTRAKPASLLTLSKQYPTIVSPKANMNTARSDRSMKSKGITLVSAQKKLEVETEVKKPVKITLMHKKILGCAKKKVDLTLQVPGKTQKKTSSFNPSSFFSSRRVSSRVM